MDLPPEIEKPMTLKTLIQMFSNIFLKNNKPHLEHRWKVEKLAIINTCGFNATCVCLDCGKKIQVSSLYEKEKITFTIQAI
jgi:hypothetical protein